MIKCHGLHIGKMAASRNSRFVDNMDNSPRLKPVEKLTYGIGHVFNDISASFWFSYFLVYFHLVLKFDSTRAGILMLIGQVTDALSTIFVGYYSDQNDDLFLCRKVGRRKAWYIIGYICTGLSFPFIFTRCLGCEQSSLNAQLVYYAGFIIWFQFGWAAVQVSHLAMIPDLTGDKIERTELTSIRSTFTSLSNLLIYSVLYFLLQNRTDSSEQIGPNDDKSFSYAAYGSIVVASLLIFVHIFYSKVNERTVNHVSRRAGHFVKKPQFYMVAVLYTCCRLFVNLSQVYFPLYLHKTLLLSATSLSSVLLIGMASNTLFSYVTHMLNVCLGKMQSFVSGVTLGLIACSSIYYATNLQYYEVCLYAIFLGAGGNIMLVTALGVTADLIGDDTDAGAFVYGSMSFADKLANGLAVMTIQYMACDDDCIYFYKDILVFVCGSVAVLGCVAFVFSCSCLFLFVHDDDASSTNSDEEQLSIPADGTEEETENAENRSNTSTLDPNDV